MGDEMNIHVPQNDQAMAELKILMDIRRKICSAQNNSPVAALVQDTLVGLYFLTKEYTRVPLDIFYDCIYALNKEDLLEDLLNRASVYYPDEIKAYRDRKLKDLPGRLLASILFPRDFYYTSKTFDDDEPVDGYVVIKNGILIKGDLVKKVLGTKTNSIVHVICIEYSCFEASDFISNAQFLCHRWFPTYSFSFGISDCLNNNQNQIDDTIKNTYLKCKEINSSNKTKGEKEILLNNELNSALSIGQSLAKKGLNKGVNNAMSVCIYSGAKGNYVNCSQISAFVGQQNVMGKRPQPSLSQKRRCLPHFKMGDNSPKARGFIDSNFINGLSPTQYFFHAQSGREGIMDTAVKTQDSGYIQRRFVKKMENFKIYNDGSVRNSDGTILAFIYGNDGLDPRELYNVDKEPFFIDVKRISERLNAVFELDYASLVPKTPKIKLEKSHISYINSKIKLIGSHLDNDVIQRAHHIIHSKLEKYLSSIELYQDKKTITAFVNIITNKFNKARIETGDMVGIIAACSLGESATQKTLNSFHHAGISSKAVTTGVPRLNEILNTTHKPKTPSTIVYINSDYIKKREIIIDSIDKKNLNIDQKYEIRKQILEKLQSYRKVFEYTTLKTFVKSTTLKYLSSSENEDEPESTPLSDIYSYNCGNDLLDCWWYKLYIKYNDNKDDERNFKINVSNVWICEIDVNIEKLFHYNITLSEIVKKCHSQDAFNNFRLIYSPLNVAKLILFVNYDAIESINNSSNYYYIRDIVLPNLLEMKITGIKGIEKMFPTQGKDPINNKERWYIDIQGQNFKKILNLKIVDFINTVSDDMWEIYNVLGIEATRNFIIEEMDKILCGDGSYINKYHFMLLADSMTQSGEIKSVQRHGIHRRTAGIFGKAVFEESVGNFTISCIFTETDNMNSVSANIPFGSLCPIGTMDNSFELLNVNTN